MIKHPSELAPINQGLGTITLSEQDLGSMILGIMHVHRRGAHDAVYQANKSALAAWEEYAKSLTTEKPVEPPPKWVKRIKRPE